MSSSERGDTIIEVLFAITIFSLISIGGLSLMNQGTAMAQRSLEIGLVRAQIDAQADALRYLNHAYVVDYGKDGPATNAWKEIVADHAISDEDLNNNHKYEEISDGTECKLPPSSPPPFNSFALDVTKLSYYTARGVDEGTGSPLIQGVESADVYSKIESGTAKGIWIQAVRSSDDETSKPGFYDFHIRACWLSPGLSTPVTMGTIVRLYEPRG